MLRFPIRSLGKFQSQDSAVGKLFAKHIKLPDAIEYVKRTKYVHLIDLECFSNHFLGSALA